MIPNKRIALVLACVMCLSLFAGCKQEEAPQGTTTVPTTQAPATEPTTEPITVPTEPAMDAETLVAKITGEDAPKMTGMEFLLQMDMSVGMADVKVDMGIEMSGNVCLSYDPVRMYMLMDMEMSSMGESEVSSFEVFGMEEDGQFVTYSYDPAWQMWSTETIPMEGDIPVKISMPENVTLREQTETYNGMECYVLNAEATGDALQELLGEDTMSELGSSIGLSDTELDLSAVSAAGVYYVEKETLLLRGVSIELQGFEEMLNSLLGGIAETAVDLSVKFPTLRGEVNRISYDAVEVPEMSEEDRLIADSQNYFPVQDPSDDPIQEPIQNPSDEPIQEPAQEDEGYVVQEGNIAFRVTVPEGWMLDYAEGAMFSLTRNGGTVLSAGTIYMDDGATLEEILQTYVQLFEMYLGTEVASGTAESINGYQVMWYSCEVVYAYMIQIPNGNGYLLLEVQSMDGSDPYTYLPEIIAAVEAVDPA